MRSLVARIAWLAAAAAVITALLAAGLTVGIVRSAANSEAQRTLSKLADAAQTTSDLGPDAEAAQRRALVVLRALQVRGVLVTANGMTPRNDPLAAVVTDRDVQALLSGRSISAQRPYQGTIVLVQGRPTRAGGIILLQRRGDAVGAVTRALGRSTLALLAGVVIAVGLSLLVAWRIVRPLRRTARAAHALAAGERDVRLSPEGPDEVAEIAAALTALSGSLERSETRQQEFLLSVSHDLRTPLTAISGYAESLAEGVVPPEEAAEVGGVMLEESLRLRRMVDDLLDLARLGAQDLRLDIVDTDVSGLVQSAARVWSDRCADAGVGFAWAAPDGVRLPTDASRLRQVLDGLLENALRVTPAGRPIVLELRAEGSGAALEVRDGGPGLTDDDLAVAFDRGALYERYRGVRRVGTGLGLAIAHRLVTRLGGTIEAGHAAEGGARFTVRLPGA
ncbi:MAG TPA: HAMP domain-containing sensor histidine kinase [Propionibacteriaceae bacterium]|nr:HAMP domain-containing sensor histidine kinase [Propionibacteriaceae bacterium]